MKRTKILLALKALLTPVARFCVRQGLKIQEIENVFKVVLLECAKRELLAGDFEVNSSRLAAISGIPRKFIPKYLADNALEEISEDILTRVLGQWQSDSRFHNSAGRPRALSIAGTQSEFCKLVCSVSLDLNSYTVLNELLRLGHIEKLESPKGEEKVRLRSRIHLLRKLPDAMALVAEDGEALQRAAEENISSGEPKHLHLTTRYDNIPESALPEIQEWLLTEGSLFHQRAREYLSAFDRDLNPKKLVQAEQRYKVHLGAFSFFENFIFSQKEEKGKKV